MTNSLDSAQIMAAVVDTDECAFDIIRHDGYSVGMTHEQTLALLNTYYGIKGAA